MVWLAVHRKYVGVSGGNHIWNRDSLRWVIHGQVSKKILDEHGALSNTPINKVIVAI